MPVKTDYNVGDFVKVSETGMPADLRGKVGRISRRHNPQWLYPVTIDLPHYGEVGFEYHEVTEATDIEILQHRLTS